MTREEATHYLPLMQWLNAHHSMSTEILAVNYGNGEVCEVGIPETCPETPEYYMNFVKELYKIDLNSFGDLFIDLPPILALYSLATGETIECNIHS